MLSNEELAALIEVGVETRGIEFKGPGSTSSKDFVALVARACMALANQRDGGHLVIGVVDKDPGGASGGLTEEQVDEWLAYDTVVAKVNTYADPPLRLALARRQLPNGSFVVVIEVAEFAEIPILSARDYGRTIVRGQLYTRSLAKPESSAQNTQNELREVLALATEKQLQTFLRTARHAGLAVEPGSSNEGLFEAERQALLQQPIASVVAGMPRMTVAICPEKYEEDWLPYESLRGLVANNAVRFRGWPFPYVHRIVHGDRWVGEAQEEMHPEVWAMHQSGQFVDVRPLPLGFGPDSDGFHDPNTDGPFLPVWFPVMFVFEAAAFAARLQRVAFLGESLNVTIALEGAVGWELVVADPRRSGFHGSYRFGSQRWERSVTLEPGAIEEDVKSIAAETSRDLLLRFGWAGVTEEIVRGMQDDLLL